MRCHSLSPGEGCGRMYCKSATLNMANVSKRSFSLGAGVGIGGLGCELGTTDGVIG